MTGVLLENFANRISSVIISDVIKTVGTFTFEYSNVVGSSDFIPFNNANNQFVNGNKIVFSTLSTENIGLVNNDIYYVVTANSTGIKISTSLNGTVKNVSTGTAGNYGTITQFAPQYYMVASKSSPFDPGNSANIPLAADNSFYINTLHNEMLFGKKITNGDIAYMIRDIAWESGVVYTMFDDRATGADPANPFSSFYDFSFYVRNTTDQVYKCLDNAGGSASTYEPTGTSINPIYTADGYKWKYMYTLSEAANSKFSVTSALTDYNGRYIPVIANTTVEQNAANGTIDTILPVDVGVGYLYNCNVNVLDVNVSTLTVKVDVYDTNSQLVSSNGYYEGCSFYVYSGAGNNNIATILTYTTNNTGHYMVLSNDPGVSNVDSIAYISPSVVIDGDGTGAQAYCVVNTTSYYTIDKYVMINSGENYSHANVSIVANLSQGNFATARAIMSPEGGHGSNAKSELGASYLCFSVDFANTESGNISTQNQFYMVGTLYDPLAFSPDTNTYNSYTGNTFNALSRVNYTLQSVDSFITGEVIRGLGSNAAAIVTFANDSYIEATSMTRNDLIQGETFQGETSSATGLIDSINTSDIVKHSGSVLYLDTFEAVARSNTSTETVKLLISL